MSQTNRFRHERNPPTSASPIYGMDTWGDLFTPRQALALTTFADSFAKRADSLAQITDGLARPFRPCLAFAVDRMLIDSSALVRVWTIAR